jgi:hypothetical protein
MKRILLILILASTASASIVSKSNSTCTNYILDNDRELQGQVKVVSKKISYGMYIHDMEIDFDQRRVLFDLKTAVSLGFDRDITSKKVSISEEHPDFKEFTNLLQKDLYFFKEVCLDKNNEVISFKMKTE